MTAEQIKKIDVFREYLKKGSIVNGNEIVDLYNEVFGPEPHTGRLQHYTSCGSCLRRLVKLLIQAAVEAKIDESDETVTEEEKEPQSEENNKVDNDKDDVEAKIDESDEPVTENEKEPQSEENHQVVNEEVTENSPQSEEIPQVDNDTTDKEKSSEMPNKPVNKPSKKKKTIKKKR